MSEKQLRGPRTEAPTYRTVHTRLTDWRGKASEYACTDCGAPATSWAYNNDPNGAFTSPEGYLYSDDLDRYRPLCHSCHVREPFRDTCKRGHPWTPESEYIVKATGLRRCRICVNERERRTGKGRKS